MDPSRRLRSDARRDRKGDQVMHIPDGYLSPSTCAVGYAIAAPFWYVALERVKRLLQTRLVPLAGGGLRLLFRRHDVQSANPGRDDSARGRHGCRRNRARTLGGDPRNIDRADDSGVVLRRRGHHRLRGQLPQHGDHRLARRLLRLSGDRRARADRFRPPHRCRRDRRIRGDQCGGLCRRL